MTTQTIRARFHNGHLEPLGPFSLPEGTEVTVTVDVQSPEEGPPKRAVKLRTKPGTVIGSLRREDVYAGQG